MDDVLSLTLIQTSLSWQDPAANLEHFETLISNIKDTDLIILPEMFTTGFSMASQVYAESMTGVSVSWLSYTAVNKRIAICGSLMIKSGEVYTNRFILAQPNGELVYYDKKHLFRMADEHHHFDSGIDQVYFDLKGFKICPQICYDLRFPVWSRNTVNYDVLLYVANWPAKRHAHWTKLLAARAIENQCYVAAVNRIGFDGNGLEYNGGSQVLNFDGEPLLDLTNRDSIQTWVICKRPLLEYRSDFPAWQDADNFTLD